MSRLSHRHVHFSASPLLLPLLPLLLLATVRYANAACNAVAQARDVNETTMAGSVIEVLDATYVQSSPLTVDNTYACYFAISNGSLILTKQFDLENFTSCVDSSTVPPASILSAVTVSMSCTGGDTATFLVRMVDMNEFPPEFSPKSFRLNVSEAAPVGTLVITLNGYVTDKDKSNQRTFNLFIVSGSGGDFAMNDGITSGTVRIQRTLDFDAGPRQYVMNVSAVDLATEAYSLPVPLSGYATLTVDVVDADDRNPYFTQTTYSLYFMENDTSFVDRPLTTSPMLKAFDGDVGINQTINYGIQSAAWSDPKGSDLGNVTFLSINQTNGLITVLSIIDREALPSNTLLVQVKGYQTDKPDTRVSTVLVIVTIGDKNDNAPIMSSALYNVSVAENSLDGSYVTTVRASDADLGENATFVFLLNDTSGAFQVDSVSGQVTVANSALLDRETRASFTMLVWAQESATPDRFTSPSPAQLVVNLIDLNDNSPTFTNASSGYAFVASSDAPIGAAIGSISAVDPDQGANGQVRYAIGWAGTGAEALFQLDPVTGALTTRASLSDLHSAVYVLQALAEDQALPVATRRRSTAVLQVTAASTATTAASTESATSTAASTDTTSMVTVSSAPPTVPTTASSTLTSSPEFTATTTNATVTDPANATDAAATTTPQAVEAWGNATMAVASVWLVNDSFAIVELTSTLTSTSGNVSSTSQFTLLPLNSTVTAAPAAAPAGLTAVQIALIVICAILLLAVLALVAMVIWCWKTRQPKPLKALSAVDLTTNGKQPVSASQQRLKNHGSEAPSVTESAATAAAAAAAAVASGGSVADVTTVRPQSAKALESADSYSPSGLSRIMFEPGPYQSLTFSMVVPEDAEGEEREADGGPILRTAV